MIIELVGSLGKGKTAGITWLAYNKLIRSPKKQIYSNYWLNPKYFSNVVYVHNVQQLRNIKNGIFLGDELWSWLDSRSSTTSQNKVVNKFLLASRKYDLDIYYSAQDISLPDLRLRRITDSIAECSKTVIYDKNHREVDYLISINWVVSPPLIQSFFIFKDKVGEMFNTKEVIEPLDIFDSNKLEEMSFSLINEYPLVSKLHTKTALKSFIDRELNEKDIWLSKDDLEILIELIQYNLSTRKKKHKEEIIDN